MKSILLFGMPGASEWLVIIIAIIFFITMPILAIVFYLRIRELRKQISELTEEKNSLLEKLLNQK